MRMGRLLERRTVEPAIFIGDDVETHGVSKPVCVSGLLKTTTAHNEFALVMSRSGQRVFRSL